MQGFFILPTISTNSDQLLYTNFVLQVIKKKQKKKQHKKRNLSTSE